MSQGTGLPPYVTALLEAQQAFARFAGSGLAANPPAGAAQQLFADQYRQLLSVPGFPFAAAGTGTPGAALVRQQQAAERVGRLLNEVAIDAGRRLAAALADDDPDLPPITTLRELHALWIDCGEAAWSAAAHREDFATAQAELLAALVALRAPGSAS